MRGRGQRLGRDGLEGLPHGAHWVVAPYGTLTEKAVPREDTGSDFVHEPARGNGGVDAKYIPNVATAIDATINPDFSQIESDVAQISANARFALLYPEKRPFFMEKSQLFKTPVQAVYTRTITSPRWGARVSGETASDSYTVVGGQDRGGGVVILPGPTSSSTAPQDFSSFFGIGRTDYDAARYATPVPKTAGQFDGSALFGYQLNWQSVVYAGYGDSRTLTEDAQLQRTSREFFLKVSYAFQH